MVAPSQLMLDSTSMKTKPPNNLGESAVSVAKQRSHAFKHDGHPPGQ